MGTVYVAVIPAVAERGSVGSLGGRLHAVVPTDTEAVLIAAYWYVAAVAVGDVVESGASAERAVLGGTGDE